MQRLNMDVRLALVSDIAVTLIERRRIDQWSIGSRSIYNAASLESNKGERHQIGKPQDSNLPSFTLQCHTLWCYRAIWLQLYGSREWLKVASVVLSPGSLSDCFSIASIFLTGGCGFSGNLIKNCALKSWLTVSDSLNSTVTGGDKALTSDGLIAIMEPQRQWSLAMVSALPNVSN
ncbi:hypothetical protein RRG08_033910 [Elysia crispata]|uniref:Uncharacterized protein n=1 Tax=Elysia crispata TaxID=231223 RepID=A0AAE1BAB0_9GAST|nr:hypothetical protein RRG08_033910 [Elysia crispata]